MLYLETFYPLYSLLSMAFYSFNTMHSIGRRHAFNMKEFLENWFYLSRFLAKTMGVNKTAMKSFLKICCSSLNCRFHHEFVELTHKQRKWYEKLGCNTINIINQIWVLIYCYVFLIFLKTFKYALINCKQSKNKYVFIVN